MLSIVLRAIGGPGRPVPPYGYATAFAREFFSMQWRHTQPGSAAGPSGGRWFAIIGGREMTDWLAGCERCAICRRWSELSACPSTHTGPTQPTPLPAERAASVIAPPRPGTRTASTRSPTPWTGLWQQWCPCREKGWRKGDSLLSAKFLVRELSSKVQNLWREFIGQIEIVSTNNLFCRKFLAVCRIFVGNLLCLLEYCNFLCRLLFNHDAARKKVSYYFFASLNTIKRTDRDYVIVLRLPKTCHSGKAGIGTGQLELITASVAILPTFWATRCSCLAAILHCVPKLATPLASNRHTARYTGPVSVLSQCKNWCLAEGFRKRRLALPYGP